MIVLMLFKLHFHPEKNKPLKKTLNMMQNTSTYLDSNSDVDVRQGSEGLGSQREKNRQKFESSRMIPSVLLKATSPSCPYWMDG